MIETYYLESPHLFIRKMKEKEKEQYIFIFFFILRFEEVRKKKWGIILK